MKLRDDTLPKSSFLAMEKDLSLIIDNILNNNRVKKLLHYNLKNPLSQKDLTEQETFELIEKNIKLVPKLGVDSSVLNYLVINFDDFSPNATNPEYRDSIISFDIICHYDQWQLNDYQLRPYRIAAELDAMFENKHLTGIGTLQFIGARRIILNDEFGGILIMYQAINGEEDRKNPLNPMDIERLFE